MLDMEKEIISNLTSPLHEKYDDLESRLERKLDEVVAKISDVKEKVVGSDDRGARERREDDRDATAAGRDDTAGTGRAREVPVEGLTPDDLRGAKGESGTYYRSKAREQEADKP